MNTFLPSSPEAEHVLHKFWRSLASADQSALLLDYDGTLAPFCIARDQAVPYPGVVESLTRIRTLTTTRLIIISGRAIDDLLPLLGLDPPPEIWGCHGWERLCSDGSRPPVELPVQARAGLTNAEGWCISQGLTSCLERKPASLAVHWRGLGDQQVHVLRLKVTEGWQSIARDYGLEIHDFNGGLELRCPGKDKGTSVISILKSMRSDMPVAFLGDDLTDEDGFKAIRGRGLGVLVNDQIRPTQALLRLSPPEELLNFLSVWSQTARPNSKDDS
ncbi:MAG: trehalose-phosphatase [Deltaproteobacteria bacterium]|jgi:trehalose-phosphatase|nr:trehalose-phosphatase [Deltaproteobacteria bacterium]MBW2519284.1 trehalose-phosphatase [Deltaproteobacteria bacterium]